MKKKNILLILAAIAAGVGVAILMGPNKGHSCDDTIDDTVIPADNGVGGGDNLNPDADDQPAD